MNRPRRTVPAAVTAATVALSIAAALCCTLSAAPVAQAPVAAAR